MRIEHHLHITADDACCKPVARGGADQTIALTDTVVLDASASTDPRAQALLAALVWNAGVIGALLLLIWVIKGYTEARWYSIAVGFLLQLCLAIYLYPTSRWFSVLTCLSLAATAFGVLKLMIGRPGKTTRTA